MSRQPAADSIAMRLLRALARLICARPRLFLYPQIFLFALCVFVTVRYLEFDMSRDNLVGSDKKYHQNNLRFKHDFPGGDDMVVVVESESLEKNRQFVERLGAKLEAETNLFVDVFYNHDPVKILGAKGLLFVPDKDLEELKKTLVDYRPFITQFTQATNLNSLFTLVNQQFRKAKQEENAENKSMVKAIPALESIVVQATESLRHSGAPPSPGVMALFGADAQAQREIYITFANGRFYLCTARERDETKRDKAIEKLRDLVGQTQFEVPGVNVGITGESVLEFDEMNQSQSDTTLATIVSLLLCAGIFIYSYRETGRPVKAVISLVLGLGYTMAFTTVVVHHLNILTITFVPILIGLAIDFGVHLITRYEEELRSGRPPQEALEKAMVYTGLGILTGALTTSGAFLAMALTDFKGIQEMGIICGAGMILCLVPMMTFLPVLLLRGRQNVLDQAHAAQPRARIEQIWLRRPALVSAITVSFCLLAAVEARRVRFDYNLLNMQSKGLASVEYGKKLAQSGESVLSAAVIATNLEQAIDLEERLKKLPLVSKVESMSSHLAEDQRRRLELVREIKKEIASIHFSEPDARPVNVPELSATLYYSSGYFGLGAEFAGADDPEVATNLLALKRSIGEFRKEILRNDPTIPARLAAFSEALFGDIGDTFAAMQKQDDRSALRIEDLPSSLRNRFVSADGKKFLLQVYPREDVWQRDKQEAFVLQVQTVDPNVTGTPVQLYYYTDLLRRSYEKAAWYALIAIAILVAIHFKSPVYVALALLPVGIGALWMVGLMGEFGISFNPANIMTLPLVIGIGVTNGINILNRFTEERSPGIFSKSTGKAVLVSGLNTMAGFGSLMLAKHQGISSLGFVMTVGVATCMVAALTILPTLLNVLGGTWILPMKKPSDDNARPALGLEEPR